MFNQHQEYRDYRKIKFSNSTDGKGILLPTSSTVIHQATTSRAINEWDEVWIYAANIQTSGVELTVEWGGTTPPNDRIIVNVVGKSGLLQVIPGLVLQNGATVSAFANTASVIMIYGFVNRYEYS